MEADAVGGGGPSTEPFPRYPVTPARVRTVGDGVTGVGGDVENLDSAVGGAHRVAQRGVAGLLADPMVTAGGQVRDDMDRWLRSTVFGGGTIRLFGDGVETYNQGIDDLNSRYWTAKANRFGLTPPDLPSGVSQADRDAAWDSFRGDVVDADGDMRAELERERHSVLEPALDEHAQWVAGLLDRGPDDAGAVVAVYQAGGMPLSAPTLFRDVDFSGVDPEQLYQNLVAGGQIPDDLAQMSEDELYEWFTNHPTEADLVSVLLLVPGPLVGGRETMVRALGRYDAWRVDRGLSLDPGRAGLAQIGAGSQRLAEINARVADGERLTDAEKAYLDAWFNGVGADNLAALPAYVDEATDIPVGMPGHAAQALYDDSREQYLTPVANAIMNLSDPSDGGVYSLEDMPQAIQDLAATPIGAVDEDTGLRWASLDEDGNPVRENVTVDGLARYGGFVDLLESSTVEGGTVFTRELGESALRVKQELNMVAATTGESLRMQMPADGHLDEHLDALRAATFDDEVSDMLSVVARNERAAGAMLVNDDDRPLLLGLNWYDDQGVVDVIRSGTDRHSAGDDNWMPAAATRALMEEVGSDRDFYLDRMTEDISDAVVDSGIEWMDTFGRAATSDSPSDYGMYENALGNEALRVQLSPEHRENFLEFISGTGDEDAMRFRAASVTYSEDLVARAVASGDASTVDVALAAAGRIDGAITAADYEFALDQEGEEYDEAMAAHQADVRRNNGFALAAKVGWGVASAGVGAATGGVGSVFMAGASPLVDAAIGEIFDAGEPPQDQTARTREELFDQNRLDQPARRNHFLLSAYDQAGITSPEDYPDLYDSNGNLRPYDELAGSGNSSDHLQDLQHARDSAEQAWEAVPGHGDIEAGQFYDRARNSIDNGSYLRYEPSGSWTDEEHARQRLYGDLSGVEDYLHNEVPLATDPGSYYQSER